jgi:hypothetical protein
MNTTSRVLVAVGAVTLMTYGSALAQDAPAQPPQAPPSTSPAAPPLSPASPGQSGQSAQTMTATGELVRIDAKANTMTVKTATDEITIKYDDETKVSGGSRNTAGLATMSGSQVVVRYRKDGTANMATTIEVKPAAAGAGPAARPTSPAGDRPTTPGGDRPTSPAPGGDPSKPTTPRP